MKRAADSEHFDASPAKKLTPFDRASPDVTRTMLKILDKFESGATFHCENNTILFTTCTRKPVRYMVNYKESCKEHWQMRKETRECLLLRTNNGFDADLIFDALAGKLPPGIHCCRNLRRKLLKEDAQFLLRISVEALQAQKRIYAAMHCAIKTAPDFPLPNFDWNPKVLEERMTTHAQRLANHSTDKSFARLMYVDVLLHVICHLVDLPKRKCLGELPTLSSVSKLFHKTIETFVRKDLASLKLERRFRALFNGSDPTKTDLLARCPFFKNNLEDLVSYPVTAMFGTGQAFPLMELSQSFVAIFGDDAVQLLDKRENAPRLRLQREQACARRTVALRQEVELLKLRFDPYNPQVQKYCRGKLKTTKLVVLALQPIEPIEP